MRWPKNIIPVYISKSSCKRSFLWTCCLVFIRYSPLAYPSLLTHLEPSSNHSPTEINKPRSQTRKEYIHCLPTTPPWSLYQPRSSDLLVPKYLQGSFVGNNPIFFATYPYRQQRYLHQNTRLQVLKKDQATICSKYSFCEWRKMSEKHSR